MLRPLDGAGNEEAEANLVAVDRMLDQMSAMMGNLNSSAQVRMLLETFRDVQLHIASTGDRAAT